MPIFWGLQEPYTGSALDAAQAAGDARRAQRRDKRRRSRGKGASGVRGHVVARAGEAQSDGRRHRTPNERD